MPSGKNHDRITLICLPCLVFISLIFIQKKILIFFLSVSFLFSGLMFGPDLDIFSVQYKRWGILRILWLPYQKMISHRSVFSHGIIIGTVVRICYLAIVVFSFSIFTVGILQLIFGFYWNWQEFTLVSLHLIFKNYQKEAIAILIGLELGAMSHYSADGLTSWFNKWNKSQKNAKKPKIKSKKRKKN